MTYEFWHLFLLRHQFFLLILTLTLPALKTKLNLSLEKGSINLENIIG
jgi:hypothetical protein